MASASLQSSLHHRLLRHQSHHSFLPADSVHFLAPRLARSSKPHPTAFTATFSASLTPSSSTTTTSTTTATPSPNSTSLDLLAHHLSAKDYRLADDETRRLLIALTGDAAVKRGYVFFSEVQFVPASELQAIDALWRESSGGRYGYSVQKRLWEKVGRDFTRFFLKVGWMKKLDTEVEQYNYRAFPAEFMWDGGDDTPEGHLPLTNALRGTQLLASIFTHPAFETDEEVVVEELRGSGGMAAAVKEVLAGGAKEKQTKKAMPSLTPDYSF